MKLTLRLKNLLTAAKPYRTAAMLLAVALGVAGWYGPGWVLGPQVAVASVSQRDFIQSVVASGHVEAPHRVSIGTQVTATVRRVPVVEGQVVEAGQVLVDLDGAEARAAAVQADAAVAQAQARLRQLREVQAPMAQQALRQAQVNLDNARAQWRRSAQLQARGFIGQAALDDARKTVELSEAQLRSAQTQLATALPGGSDHLIATTELAQAHASAIAAHAREGYTTIAAPVAGTLIARAVEPGDVVQPGKALMVLSPAGRTELVVQIDEKNLRLLALGQPAQASADAYPDRRFDATLDYINPGVDVQSGSVEVKLGVPEPPPYLKQDMTVSVDIRVATRARALLVSLDAVHDADAAQPWVLKVEGRRARRQGVRLGLRSGGLAEVLAGLQAGDRVVPLAASDIHDGSRLRPLVATR
ncbi:MAG: efflux RND transporter periplasmic adaptor subunit [Burkholderiales bacterium]|nr:efflux RND transporter periplasmic adaptor subunit [Burkholderiales bacterium]